MEGKSFEGKHNFKDKAYREGMVDDDLDYETEEDEVGGGGHGGSNGCTASGFSENEKKKRGTAAPSRGRSSGVVSSPSCQAHNCATDLSEAKRYHRRHKVCEFHSKAAVVMVAGIRQRFCQQCSRYLILQNLMKLNGAVAGGWQDTTNEGGRARPSAKERARAAKDQPRSQRTVIAGSWWKIKEAELRWLQQEILAINTCISDKETIYEALLSLFCQ